MAGVVETSPEYYLQRVEFTPDSVEVLAPSAILDTITEAFITPVYFSDCLLTKDDKHVASCERGEVHPRSGGDECDDRFIYGKNRWKYPYSA